MVSNIRALVRQFLRIGPTPNQQRFAAMMDLAWEMEKVNPEGLVNLVRLLGRRVQGHYMSDTALVFQTNTVPRISPDTVLFSQTAVVTPTVKYVGDLMQQRAKHRDVLLTQDIVLPWPWRRGRLTRALANIGPGRPWGAWEYDPANHSIEVWEPMGICWVKGGNHSIAAGIIQGTGSIPVEEVVDISAVYQYVWCDGKHFIRRIDNTAFAKVRSIECAAIFEIGRLMLDHGLSA